MSAAPRFISASALLVVAALLAGCAAVGAPGAGVQNPAAAADPYAPQREMRVTPPAWSRDATIYQVNLRQFTPEGTLRAAEAQLPRLKDLGVDILWLMPIHPIGEKNRKGTLGSPYAVRDYRAVNPEFGSFADLKRFVDRAHALGLKVILDWVANHSAWDNPLVTTHPEWYERDWKGDFHPTSWWDWSDIIEFDYGQVGLRRYMAESMAFWVREAGVDGFRCDVAGYVPIDFWNAVRRDLQAIKPVFMLAEAATRDLHFEAFEASYGWSLHSGLHEVARKGASVDALAGYYSEQDNLFPRGSMRLVFTSNHDKNSWEGTEFEMFGPAVEAAIVLTFVGDGIPTVYNGQEAGNTKRLQFFERDPIEWRAHPHEALFRSLNALKAATPALWNGPWGARMVRTANSSPQRVLSFVREHRAGARDGLGGALPASKLLAVFNFSAEPRRVTLSEALAHGVYREPLAAQPEAERRIDAATEVELAPWGWRVFTR